ncbi:hypothetical protein [Psychrobacter sp. M9-54-1]|nr:hypothetical protein [Psychrobacter sp. M9-54-1]
MENSTNNQQPLKGSKKWLKKSIFLLLKAFKIIGGVSESMLS